METLELEIWFHNKYSYCKFQDTCRKQHVYERCEDKTCKMKDCPRRHPKECYYFRSYDGRCKFGTACFYDHREENRFEPLEKEIEDLHEEYERLKQIFSEKEVETKILFQQMRESFKDEFKASPSKTGMKYE